jgi:hypothetical protein
MLVIDLRRVKKEVDRKIQKRAGKHPPAHRVS